MNEYGRKAKNASVADFGLGNVRNAYWNVDPAELVEDVILQGEGFLTETGALAIDTGEFTGRSPKDRFIVKDANTENTVWWEGSFNTPFDPAHIEPLMNRMKAYTQNRDIYVRDCIACADPAHKLNIRVITEFAWSSIFASNMFIRPTGEEIETFEPEWTVLCLPNFHGVPEIDGTRQHNFSILDFTRKIALIGGSGYTGEIKKGIFTVLNYVLPQDKGVLSMHCSANTGKDGDTAVFFGLSGTGKTTLSADPNRALIGDDEHGWTENGIFNFEGGCYAKCIDLTEEKEPEIWKAIKFGALLENIEVFEGTTKVDFENSSKTENTRVSYPIDHIEGIAVPSSGGIPQNIFFLTADAFGVLPPVSKLTPGQAMYHFISGYTAKVAGTEEGVTEPQTTFSACFGAPFLPLHPTKYAEMLGEKMKAHNVNIWLINTGWSGGEYGVGSRIKLKYTRAMITAALTGQLNDVDYKEHEVFGLNMPTSCPDVPAAILDPRNTWTDQSAYDKKANTLANAFVKNFEIFASDASDEIMAAAPNIAQTA
ncbi:MAG: phosphoenolpyruvate carboxykinase (ATP) [Flavobacteriales bacterium]|nr:phosphoenolpyruvate carboxykinase (ATP) [Flavobacteriales bacterium]